MSVGPLAEVLRNPFLVLELDTTCTRAEVERAAQRISALLQIKTSAREYPTPCGPATRDAELVRASAAALRDPNQRLIHEIWATWLREIPCSSLPDDCPRSWQQAARGLGWGTPWPIP